MTDIGSVLNQIMHQEKCSSVYAFYLLTKAQKETSNELCKLQSESDKKTSRRLRDKSDF